MIPDSWEFVAIVLILGTGFLACMIYTAYVWAQIQNDEGREADGE